MSVTLPYPVMSGSFVPTGASAVDQFDPTTVHSDSVHNNPHAKLLANDIALKNATDTVINTSYKQTYWNQYVPSGNLFTAEPTFEQIIVSANSFSTMFFVEINVGLYTPDYNGAPGVLISPTHNMQKGIWIPTLSPLPPPITQPFGFVGVFSIKTGHYWGRELYIQRSFKHSDVSVAHTFTLRTWDVTRLHEITVRVYGY